MPRLLVLFLAAALGWTISTEAQAQCAGGLIVNCPAGVSLQANDVFLAYQLAQSPHYRKVTGTQLLTAGFPAAFSSLTTTAGGTMGGTWTLNGAGTGLAVTNGATVGGSLGVTGAANLSGGGTAAGAFAFSGPITITGTGTGLSVSNNTLVGGTLGVTGLATLSSVRGRAQNFVTASVPTPLGPGDTIWETDCQNGSEAIGSPSGCPAISNNSGVYVRHPSPPTLGITFGTTGLFARLGGTVPTQGNGTSLLSASGTFIPGNAITTNASGVAIDAGVPPGGGVGGTGTVANCIVAGSLATYAAAGTTVTCLPQTNSSIVSRSSGGVLTEATALPSAFTAPNLNLTGTATAIGITLTGKLTEAASLVGGANFNIPQGTAPTAPTNGDVWMTSTGLFEKNASSVTPIGPLIGTAQLSVAASTLGYNSATGQFSCPSCVATWTAPLSFVTGTATVASFPWQAVFLADATTIVHNDTYLVPDRWRYTSGTITDIYFWTAGSSTPSFNVTLQANGTNVTGCTNIAVTAANTAASPGTATCSAANTLAHNQPLALVISSVAGSPVSAGVGINGNFTP